MTFFIKQNSQYEKGICDRMTWYYMKAKRAVMLIKKVIYFGEFGYLNSLRIKKSIILMFLSPSRDQFTLL